PGRFRAAGTVAQPGRHVHGRHPGRRLLPTAAGLSERAPRRPEPAVHGIPGPPRTDARHVPHRVPPHLLGQSEARAAHAGRLGGRRTHTRLLRRGRRHGPRRGRGATDRSADRDVHWSRRHRVHARRSRWRSELRELHEGAAGLMADEIDKKTKPRWAKPVAIIASVLVIALVAVGAWLIVDRQSANERDERREAYLQAARQTVLNLTTINADTADADVARLLEGATGDF